MNLITLKIYWDILKIGLIALGTFLLIGMVLSIPLCLLWNWLMPNIFQLPTITVFEAFGLSALVTFLSPTKINFRNKATQKQNLDITNNVSKSLDKIMKEFEA